jgi:hypothetical protein
MSLPPAPEAVKSGNGVNNAGLPHLAGQRDEVRLQTQLGACLERRLEEVDTGIAELRASLGESVAELREGLEAVRRTGAEASDRLFQLEFRAPADMEVEQPVLVSSGGNSMPTSERPTILACPALGSKLPASQPVQLPTYHLHRPGPLRRTPEAAATSSTNGFGGARTPRSFSEASDLLEDKGKLKELFDECDVNRSGRINKRELIKALRSKPGVADFLGLTHAIRPEGGKRTAFELFFQGSDGNDDRELSWEEFQRAYNLLARI